MGAFLRRYGTGSGANVAIPMVKAGSSDFAAGGDWTPATGDVKVSKDGAAQANIATLPTYSNGDWIFAFSDAELQCKQLSVRIVDSATKAVEDSGFNVETYGDNLAMLALDFDVNGANLIAIGGNAAKASALGDLATAIIGAEFVLDTLSRFDDIDSGLGVISNAAAAIQATTDQISSFDFVDAGARFLTMIELDGLVYRLTTNALEQAPSGGGGGSGSGARLVTVTVDDGNGNELENATVRFTEGANTYIATTDQQGVAVFALDDATYSIRITKDGYQFAPTTQVVDGDEAITKSMTQITYSTPSDPARILVYGTAYNGDGSLATGETLHFRLVTPPAAGVGAFAEESVTVTAHATTAIFEIELLKGATYKARGENTRGTALTTPSSGSSWQVNVPIISRVDGN